MVALKSASLQHQALTLADSLRFRKLPLGDEGASARIIYFRHTSLVLEAFKDGTGTLQMIVSFCKSFQVGVQKPKVILYPSLEALMARLLKMEARR